MKLEDNIQSVKGIGEKNAQALGKLGITTVKDIIFYYPRAYKKYSDPISVSETNEGERVAVFSEIVS